MRSGREWIRRWAAAGLLVGLFLAGMAFGRGQGALVLSPLASPTAKSAAPTADKPAPPAPPAPPPVAAPTGDAAAPGQPPAAGLDGKAATADPSKDDASKPKEPPSIWSKVPPPITFPRLGNFFILPTGPGYYSLKDVLTDECREKPPVYPWPPYGLDIVPFYDNNFRYLDDPKNTQFDWVDPIKRIHLGCDWLLSIGGEERIRFNDEYDSRLSGKTNIFDSERSRIYGDLWYRDDFRIFVEWAYVETTGEELPPSATDIDKNELLNLFVDVKLGTINDHPVYVRTGRQELNYGSQRLISQTDFPNAPRTFDGVKLFCHGDKLDVDAFLTRPVVQNPNDFNDENDKATFAGLWSTYRPIKGQAVDAYWLYLENATPLAPAPVGGRGGFDCNTLGLRYYGDYKLLVWDFEDMYQFGDHGAQTTSAGASSTGAGLHFADAPMSPMFWVNYDFASGSHNPGKGDYGTFNQLFPNGHFYFGWTDLVGRQNIDDVSLQTWFWPANWITCTAQAHFLRLDSAKDALYNAAGAVLRSDPTGRAGTNVGDVLTGSVNFHLSQHSDVWLQYSHLYSGEFIQRTGPSLSPDFFYVQYTFRW